MQTTAEPGHLPANRPQPGVAPGATPAWLALPAVLLVTFITFVPSLIMLRYSFNQYDRFDLMIETFTLENYLAIAQDPYFRTILWRTIQVAFLSTVLAVIFAFPLAYSIARSSARVRSYLIVLVVFPLLVGNVVRAAGWMAVIGNGGFVNRSLLALGIIDEPVEMLFTTFSVVLGTASVVLPFVVLTLQSVLQGIDANLEHAASSLGARPAVVFFRVILPLALPATAAATVLVFILCMNAYATPVLLGGPRFQMMAPQVYEQVTGQSNWPFGAALAFVLVVTTFTLTALSSWWLQRKWSAR